MALTITNLTSGSSTTSSSSLIVSGVSASVNDWLVVCIAADNAGGGGAVSLSSVVDSSSNPYVGRGGSNGIVSNDPGAGSAGATLGLYTTSVTGALSSGTLTVNFSPNTTSKAAVVYRVQPGAGEIVNYQSAGTGVLPTNTTGQTITASSVTSGDTIFGAIAIETNVLPTADSDTTNGSWSSAFTLTADTTVVLTSMVINAQWKTVTGTADQIYNTSTAANTDSAINWLTIYPAVSQRGNWSVNGITLKSI